MIILRVILFLGLVLHKVVWEVLKRKEKKAGGLPPGPSGIGVRLVKLGKGLFLVLVACQTLFLDLLPISSHPLPLRMVGTLLYLGGLAMALSGRLQLGKNWVDLEDYQVLPGQRLVMQGIYRYIRHPIYAGDLILLGGLELALNSWLVLGVLLLLGVVIRQARAEEALLSQTFPEYAAYCARTKRFLPWAY